MREIITYTIQLIILIAIVTFGSFVVYRLIEGFPILEAVFLSSAEDLLNWYYLPWVIAGGTVVLVWDRHQASRHRELVVASVKVV
jgi:hypothetical protein